MNGITRIAAAALTLSLPNCAADFSGRQVQGRIILDSDDNKTVVYILDDYEFEKEIHPILHKGGSFVENYLARSRSSLEAHGKAQTHQIGRFRLIYFCEGLIRTPSIQIFLEDTNQSLNRYQATCTR